MQPLQKTRCLPCLRPATQGDNIGLGLDLGDGQGVGDDFQFDMPQDVDMQPPVGTAENEAGRGTYCMHSLSFKV